MEKTSQITSEVQEKDGGKNVKKHHLKVLMVMKQTVAIFGSQTKVDMICTVPRRRRRLTASLRDMTAWLKGRHAAWAQAVESAWQAFYKPFTMNTNE